VRSQWASVPRGRSSRASMFRMARVLRHRGADDTTHVGRYRPSNEIPSIWFGAGTEVLASSPFRTAGRRMARVAVPKHCGLPPVPRTSVPSRSTRSAPKRFMGMTRLAQPVGRCSQASELHVVEVSAGRLPSGSTFASVPEHVGVRFPLGGCRRGTLSPWRRSASGRARPGAAAPVEISSWNLENLRFGTLDRYALGSVTASVPKHLGRAFTGDECLGSELSPLRRDASVPAHPSGGALWSWGGCPSVSPWLRCRNTSAGVCPGGGCPADPRADALRSRPGFGAETRRPGSARGAGLMCSRRACAGAPELENTVRRGAMRIVEPEAFCLGGFVERSASSGVPWGRVLASVPKHVGRDVALGRVPGGSGWSFRGQAEFPRPFPWSGHPFRA
jgi:hypothetical protein